MAVRSTRGLGRRCAVAQLCAWGCCSSWLSAERTRRLAGIGRLAAVADQAHCLAVRTASRVGLSCLLKRVAFAWYVAEQQDASVWREMMHEMCWVLWDLGAVLDLRATT